MSWLDSLADELRTAGIPAERRRRIVAELADHLACDPASEARLGDPTELARRFADEVGTVLARRAAVGAFLSLVPLGALFVALVTLTGVRSANLGTALTVALVLGVQLAFVGGALALLRAWRLRRVRVLPAAEATVLVRRAALGVAGGVVTVAALAVQGSPFAWVTVGVGGAALLAGGAVLARAARLRPVAAGEAGGLELDLGPFVPPALRGSPWRIALVVAGVVAFAIAADGAVLGDGIDGLVRGVGDGVLTLAGFALLGRSLGLRR
jgi:hypothetical protein